MLDNFDKGKWVKIKVELGSIEASKDDKDKFL